MPSVSQPTRTKGFTLIELLIVIAIILILIAIALPNFLEAQKRARVTKAKGEMRSIKTAFESYFIDFNVYPAYSFPNYTVRPRTSAGITWLTSPIQYLTSIPEDPFPGDFQTVGGHLSVGGDKPPYSYTIGGLEKFAGEMGYFLNHPHQNCATCGALAVYVLYSAGPDTPRFEVNWVGESSPLWNSNGNPISSYSPTNGTNSRGDLLVYGGDQRWMGVVGDTTGQGIPTVARNDRYQSLPKPGQVVDGVLYRSKFPDHLQ